MHSRHGTRILKASSILGLTAWLAVEVTRLMAGDIAVTFEPRAVALVRAPPQCSEIQITSAPIRMLTGQRHLTITVLLSASHPTSISDAALHGQKQVVRLEFDSNAGPGPIFVTTLYTYGTFKDHAALDALGPTPLISLSGSCGRDPIIVRVSYNTKSPRHWRSLLMKLTTQNKPVPPTSRIAPSGATSPLSTRPRIL